jgi:probable rRNA maturation factor
MAFNYFYTLKENPFKITKIKKWSDYLLKKFGNNFDFSLHLIGEKKMARMNYVYRHKEKATDVLSFSTNEASKKEFINDNKDIGDIFICLPVLKKQAKEYGVTEEQEFLRLFVHGFLHLNGYDHKKGSDEKIMFSKQENLINKLIKL